jgi:hypothetical protein
MTTPYGVSTSNGSQSFQGYVNTPVTGPLTTNNYPFSMSYHSYGTLSGQRPTPQQFYSGQEPVNSEMNVNARRQYIRATDISVIQKAKEDALGKLSTPVMKVSYSSQRRIPVSSHVNYIAPMDSSSRLDRLKSMTVGKSAYKVGLPLAAPISTKNYYPSGTKSALQRARSAGSCAPKKKGSIYNYSLTQPGINALGALPRSTY